MSDSTTHYGLHDIPSRLEKRLRERGLSERNVRELPYTVSSPFRGEEGEIPSALSYRGSTLSFGAYEVSRGLHLWVKVPRGEGSSLTSKKVEQKYEEAKKSVSLRGNRKRHSRYIGGVSVSDESGPERSLKVSLTVNPGCRDPDTLFEAFWFYIKPLLAAIGEE